MITKNGRQYCVARRKRIHGGAAGACLIPTVEEAAASAPVLLSLCVELDIGLGIGPEEAQIHTAEGIASLGLEFHYGQHGSCILFLVHSNKPDFHKNASSCYRL